MLWNIAEGGLIRLDIHGFIEKIMQEKSKLTKIEHYLLERVGVMKHQTALLTIVLTVLAAGAYAVDVTGDWQLTADFNGQAFESILSISKNAEGVLGGYMINSFMTTEIKDVKVEENKLTFKQQMQSMNGPSESTFTGTITDGTLTGTQSSEMGDFPMSGKKMVASAPVGKWEFRQQFQDQEFVSTLTVSADAEGKLSASMSSQMGDNEMSDVAFKDGKLTFKRVMDFNGQTMEMSYQFAVIGGKLKGTMTTDRGDREMEGSPVGPAIVGNWMLSVNSDFGEMKQLLQVKPDLSALYGTAKIAKITYDDAAKTVSFKYSMSFGGQSMENEFSGKIEDGKLTGEMNTGQGTSAVTGIKI